MSEQGKEVETTVPNSWRVTSASAINLGVMRVKRHNGPELIVAVGNADILNSLGKVLNEEGFVIDLQTR